MREMTEAGVRLKDTSKSVAREVRVADSWRQDDPLATWTRSHTNRDDESDDKDKPADSSSGEAQVQGKRRLLIRLSTENLAVVPNKRSRF